MTFDHLAQAIELDARLFRKIQEEIVRAFVEIGWKPAVFIKGIYFSCNHSGSSDAITIIVSATVKTLGREEKKLYSMCDLLGQAVACFKQKDQLAEVVLMKSINCARALTEEIFKLHGTTWKTERDKYYEAEKEALMKIPAHSIENLAIPSFKTRNNINAEVEAVIKTINSRESLFPKVSEKSEIPMFPPIKNNSLQKNELKKSIEDRKKKAKWK